MAGVDAPTTGLLETVIMVIAMVIVAKVTGKAAKVATIFPQFMTLPIGSSHTSLNKWETFFHVERCSALAAQ